MSPIHHYRDYAIEKYGVPLYTIPVDMGAGCPHRNDETRGCTFCPEHGGRAVQIGAHNNIFEQVRTALVFARRRYRAKKFILYSQAFSSTMDLDEEAKQRFRDLLALEKFEAISIGTRPDCLSEDAYSFLAELQEQQEVWVELGIQTVHDATLKRIHRGHNWSASKQAIEKLARQGVRVIAHVILGLPGEEQSHFDATAETLRSLPIDAIKIHNLHIVKNTLLAEEYQQSPFPVYDSYEYGEILMRFLRHIPWGWPVMRLNTDTPAEDLIAPLWRRSKGAFREYIEKQMVCRQWRQGDLGKSEGEASLQDPIITQDGSTTFWNEEVKEHYHTPAGARLEAQDKYIKPSQLDERLVENEVQLLDICFGLGYNSLLAVDLAATLNKNKLCITALEMDRRVVGSASISLQKWNERLKILYEKGVYQADSFEIEIHWGDARFTIRSLAEQAYDIIFLDAFSTQRNSELWTIDFFQMMKRVIKNDGVLVTYCAALPVRAGLQQAGFYIGQTEPVGRQRGGTIASLDASKIILPIPEEEMDKLSNTKPYRDPFLCASNREILRARQDAASIISV